MASIETNSPSPRNATDLAVRFEGALGNPFDLRSPVPFRELVESDDRAEPPTGLLTRLAAWGFGDYLVPEPFGGRLRDFDELLWLCRCLARRDMRGALGYGTTLLGANPVWLWGTEQQRKIIAEKVRGGDFGSYAMSERDHGSDLGSYEVTARRTGNQIVLNGQKWPIGNATRGTFATVYARSATSRLYSLVLVDKSAVPLEERVNEPLATTLGLRGHDLSGINFSDCAVSQDMMIGREGSGTAKALKSLQITRILISSMSLGSLDTALRTTLGHCRDRRLYGITVDQIPSVTTSLVTAYVDLIISECVAGPVSRAITTAPDRLSIWSSVVKYLVPTTADAAIADLARVFSARGYIRHDERAAVFQKVQRDHLAAGIFEGTSHVNLGNVATQLQAIATTRANGPAEEELLDKLFVRDIDVAPWDPDATRLELSNHGRDEIGGSWPSLVAEFGTSGTLGDAIGRLDKIRSAAFAEAARMRAANATSRTSLRAFKIAHVHCLLHAAASCLLTWQRNRATGTEPAPWWVVACLQRIVQRLDPLSDLDGDVVDAAMRALTGQFERNELFSLETVPLG